MTPVKKSGDLGETVLLIMNNQSASFITKNASTSLVYFYLL